MLASKGAKKTQVDKALVALAEQGKIMCKEFGKTKIFFPSQEGLAQLEPEVSPETSFNSPSSPPPHAPKSGRST